MAQHEGETALLGRETYADATADFGGPPNFSVFDLHRAPVFLPPHRMHHYLAFLRGINLGQRRIKMDQLADLFRELKFAEVETFIASGNVIFCAKTAAGPLTAQIEKHLHASLGYEVDTFLRTRAELAAIAAFQPFSAADMANPANTVHVGFFAAPLAPDQHRGMTALRSLTDDIRLNGREYYWLCRGIKSHESKFWTSPAMRALKLPSSSMRNVTTIRKLAELYPTPAKKPASSRP